MKEQVKQSTWKTFFLLQPALLFYAYLVGCFFHATIRRPPYGPEDFPFDFGWLIFVAPSALLLGLVTYSLTRKILCASRTIILLFFVVPFGSALLVQLFFFVVFSVITIRPAG